METKGINLNNIIDDKKDRSIFEKNWSNHFEEKINKIDFIKAINEFRKEQNEKPIKSKKIIDALYRFYILRLTIKHSEGNPLSEKEFAKRLRKEYKTKYNTKIGKLFIENMYQCYMIEYAECKRMYADCWEGEPGMDILEAYDIIKNGNIEIEDLTERSKYFAEKSSTKNKWSEERKRVIQIYDDALKNNKPISQKEAIEYLINNEPTKTINRELQKGKNKHNLIMNILRSLTR